MVGATVVVGASIFSANWAGTVLPVCGRAFGSGISSLLVAVFGLMAAAPGTMSAGLPAFAVVVVTAATVVVATSGTGLDAQMANSALHTTKMCDDFILNRRDTMDNVSAGKRKVTGQYGP